MSQVIPTEDDLVFRCDGILYDAHMLERLDTNDPQHPAIYVSHSRHTTFLLTVNEIGVLSIRRLARPELMRLCTRYGLDIPSQ
jgi:hypothetical protein